MSRSHYSADGTYISSLSVGKTVFHEVHFLLLHSCFGAVFHGFITALMVHTQQPISRGSLGVHGLGMLPLLNVLLHDLLAALSRL